MDVAVGVGKEECASKSLSLGLGAPATGGFFWGGEIKAAGESLRCSGTLVARLGKQPAA